MGDVTIHFSLAEFRCRDGSDVPEEYLDNVQRLAELLEVIRAKIGARPIRVISGYRSPKYNKKIGGARHSRHMTAEAGDLQARGMTPDALYAAIRELIEEGLHVGGLGRYRNFIHVDVRTGRVARWQGKGLKDTVA